MKAELAPKYSQCIGDNYVSWFKASNSYSVISNKTYQLLITYLHSETEDDFFQYDHKHQSVTKQELVTLNHEFSCFLEEMNATPLLPKTEAFSLKIPESKITNYYDFGDTQFTINYSSEKVRQLIHPKLQHGTVAKNNRDAVTFDIFVNDSFLHLYKNRSFIGSYETKNFHFLQGKFSMQLLEVLYNTTESDWLATFHASTICNDKEAIMIIGDSGNGKSTLSAVLMAHGYDLLADDFTPMLAETQHLYRNPAAISIKKGAFSMMETLFEDFNSLQPAINTSKQITVKYVPPSNSFKNSKKHFECHKIVLVNYNSDGVSELTEIPSEKLLQILIPDSWISPKDEHSKLFLHWLSTLKFYELSYSSNDFALANFDKLFQQ